MNFYLVGVAHGLIVHVWMHCVVISVVVSKEVICLFSRGVSECLIVYCLLHGSGAGIVPRRVVGLFFQTKKISTSEKSQT